MLISVYQFEGLIQTKSDLYCSDMYARQSGVKGHSQHVVSCHSISKTGVFKDPYIKSHFNEKKWLHHSTAIVLFDEMEV